MKRVPAPRPKTDEPLAGVRILIVDDDAAVRGPMGRFLGRRGAQVHEATDGADALTKLERYTIDVILLDIRMPRMDGVEFFTELTKKRPALAERVLFVSGDFRPLEQAQDVVVPRERTLAKPVDLAELEALVLECATATQRTSSAAPPEPTG